MGRKQNTALAIAALAGATYFASRALKKRNCHLLAQAVVSMNDKEYAVAIEYLTQIPVKSNEVLLLLSDSHYKLHNVVKAVEYLNMCVENVRGSNTIFGRMREAVMRFLSKNVACKHEDLKHLIEKRLSIYKENSMNAEAFKDAFLLSVMNDDANYKSIRTEYLKLYTLERSKSYKISGWASTINFEDFFQTLFFLENVKDPSVVFISSGEYEKCYEYVRDGSSDLHRFLKGCFLYVNGDVRSAAATFLGETYAYSKMMFIFIKATTRPSFMTLPGWDRGVQQSTEPNELTNPKPESKGKELADKESSTTTSIIIAEGGKEQQVKRGTGKCMTSNDKRGKKWPEHVIKRLNVQEQGILEELMDSEDLTVQFYASKIFEGLAMVDMQTLRINACLANRKTAPGMGQKIIILIKQDKRQEAINLIMEAVNTFPDDINIHCIAIEYFLHIGDYCRGAELLQQAECFHKNDPRVFIFKYLLSKATGNPDIGYLREGIKADPKYFKTYIHLGNHLMGEEESLRMYKDALDCARNFDELFTTFQVLTVVETEQVLSAEYPELFAGG